MISYRQPNLFRLLNKVLNFKYKLSGLLSSKNISLEEKGKVLNDICLLYTSSNLSYISAGKNLTLNAKNNILNKEGNILAVNDVNIKAKNLTNETYLIDITTKAEWRQNYEMHGDAMYKLGYNQYYYDGQLYNHNRDKGYTIVKTDITWKVGSDKPTLISAGGKANIDVVETIGNGTLSNKVYGVDEKHINTEEVSLNESNIQKTGTINTEEYTKIPTGDKGLFKVNEEFINNNTFEIRCV